MNKSFSKLRNIQSKNLQLESKFIEKKPKRLILSEGETFVEPTFDIKGGGGEDKNVPFGTVDACKKESPYNVVTNLGLKFGEVQKKWIASGCMGKTPCDQNEARTKGYTNIHLRNAVCDGWRPDQSSDDTKKDSDKIDFEKDPMFGGGGKPEETNTDSQIIEF